MCKSSSRDILEKNVLRKEQICLSCIQSFVSFKGSIYSDNVLQVNFITVPKDSGDSVFFVSVVMYLYILLLSLNCKLYR